MEQERNASDHAAPKSSIPWKLLILVGVAGLIALPLLVTLLVPYFIGGSGFGQRSSAQATLVALGSALDEYALRNGGHYPESLDVLCKPDANGVTFLGRKTLPLDPWKQEYLYSTTEDGSDFILETFGKDEEEGGTGDNEDIRVTGTFSTGK